MTALVIDPNQKGDGWSECTDDPRTKRNRQRKRPWSQMSMVDGSPLRIPVEGELDVDGDPFMRVPFGQELAEARLEGLLQAGHGFLIEKTAAFTPVQVQCRYCGAHMYGADSSEEWLCEFGESPSPNCRCNWCLHREAWLAGEFRGRGRPRIQCGAPACKRELAKERKRRSRARTPAARACHV